MKRSAIFLTVLGLMALLIVGCKKDSGTEPTADNPPAGVTNEDEAIQALALTNEFVVNDEQTFSDRDVQPADYGTFGKIDAAIIPVRFGRFINRVDKQVTLTKLGDTLAIAHVEKNIYGNFVILAKLNPTDTVFTLIQKPFQDRATRNIIFKRFARNTARWWWNWLPVASSLVEGKTVPPANPVNFYDITITKYEMVLPDGSTITVTNPDSTFLRFGWVREYLGREPQLPVLMAGDSVLVRVTVKSAAPDTDLVALRYGFSFIDARRAMMRMVSETNNGDGTYTRVYEKKWRVHFHRGYFHAGVDAATKATIFDSEPTSYSVSWWGVPYRVM